MYLGPQPTELASAARQPRLEFQPQQEPRRRSPRPTRRPLRRGGAAAPLVLALLGVAAAPLASGCVPEHNRVSTVEASPEPGATSSGSSPGSTTGESSSADAAFASPDGPGAYGVPAPAGPGQDEFGAPTGTNTPSGTSAPAGTSEPPLPTSSSVPQPTGELPRPPEAAASAPIDASVSGGALRWVGDFESGSTSPWSVREAVDGRIRTYSTASDPEAPAPLQGSHAARLQAADSDLRSPNVRSQLDGPNILKEGDDVYYRFAVNFPETFPSNLGLGSDFFTFAELMGAPFDGVPINGVFGIRKDSSGGPQRITWSRSAEFGYDEPWSTPMTKDTWHDFVFHTKLSRDGSVGFVEIWHNGVQQTFDNGSTRIYQPTYRSNNTSGLYPVITNYRAAGSYGGTVTMYADAARIGTSLASVMN